MLGEGAGQFSAHTKWWGKGQATLATPRLEDRSPAALNTPTSGREDGVVQTLQSTRIRLLRSLWCMLGWEHLADEARQRERRPDDERRRGQARRELGGRSVVAQRDDDLRRLRPALPPRLLDEGHSLGQFGQSNLGQPRATSGNLSQSRAISPRLLDEGHRLADEVAHLEALAVGGQEDEDHVEVLHRRRQPEQPHRVGEAEAGFLEP